VAKLPDRMALGSVRLGANTPDVRVGSPDYGILSTGINSLERGSQQLARGGQQLAEGFAAGLEGQNKEEEFKVQKQLLDWKLQTEMDLETAKREMPIGGENFSSSWGERYKERATEFVGEKDANIPERLRGRVGMEMKRHEISLSERAQRYEFAERDKAVVDGLNSSASAVLSQIEADPNRKDEMFEEGRKLIETAPIPPADRHRLLQNFGKQADKTAAVSRLMKAQTKEEYDALQKDLAPNAPDKMGAPLVAGPLREIDRTETRLGTGVAIKPAGIVFHYTGGTTAGGAIDTLRKRGLAYHYLVDKDGSIVRLVNPDSQAQHMKPGEGKNVSNDNAVGISYVGRSEGDISPAQRAAGRMLAARVAQQYGIDQGNVYGHGEVNSHKEKGEGAVDASWIRKNGFGDLGHEPPAAGGEPAPLAKRGMMTAPGDRQAEAPATYAGPYSNLTLTERKAIHAQAQSQWNKQLQELKGAIDKQASIAGEGIPPPQHVLDTIDAKVKAANDPGLSAHYGAMLGKLAFTTAAQKAPPAQAEEVARNFRETAERDGATPEQFEMVKHAEKLATNIRKQVNDNPVAWAHKVGIEVPLADGPPGDLEPGQRDKWQMPVKKAVIKQLDFRAEDIDGQLDDRFETAKGIARYYGQPFQGFSVAERDALKDVLKVGGPNMLTIMGKIAARAQTAGVDPALVMQEITRDAPEVAQIGTMVAEGSDPRILETAAKALSWKNQMKDKFDSTIDKSSVKPDLAEYAEVLSTNPTKVDSVKHLANLVYEYEARQAGEQSFNQKRYKDVLGRIMGQTTGPDGTTYGGVGHMNNSWLDGKSSNAVMVPPGVKTDGFDRMVAQIRASDLAKTGMPMGKDGQPLTMTEIRNATWVSIGPGRYWLQKSRADTGERQLALDNAGQPFVMDVRPILGNIKQRQPDIFAGFDPTTMTVPAPTADPALPSFWTGQKPTDNQPPVTELQPVDADPAIASP